MLLMASTMAGQRNSSAMGISFLAEFASGVCKDAGCTAMSSQIELFGKLSMLVTGLPVILALFETLNQWM